MIKLQLRVKSEELRVVLNIAKRFLYFSLFTLHFSLLSFSSFAEEPKISVKAELSKAFITIGDPVTYTVQVQHVPEIKVLSNIQPPDASILKVKKSEDIQKKEAGRLYDGKRFTVTAYSLGEYVLEPQTIQYLDTDGQRKSLQTDKIYLTVKSVAEGEEKTDIRGIKPVIELPKKFIKWLLITGGILIALFIFYLFKKKAIEITVAQPQTIRTSEEEALFQLSQLFDSDLIRNGRIKEYYLKFSDILRAYFERRFKIAATEATTYEIQRSLRDKDVEAPLRDLINEVLEAADLAKFAKWKPEPAQIIQLNQKAKQIVEMAKPKEVSGGI
jgi:hypothetical protein